MSSGPCVTRDPVLATPTLSGSIFPEEFLADLSWTAVPGATVYRVWRRRWTGGSCSTANMIEFVGETSGTTMTDGVTVKSVMPGGMVCPYVEYWVYATDGAYGYSAHSNHAYFEMDTP
jgi:hypothetical protein